MKTKIVYSSKFIILLLGIVNKIFDTTYHTIMMFGVAFSTKKEGELSDTAKNHEYIHVRQYWESFVVGMIIAAFFIGLIWQLWALWLLLLPFLLFYILYGIECIISFVHHLFKHRKKDIGQANKTSYDNCAFEQEARMNEGNLNYLCERKPLAWIRYYGKV